MLWYSAAAAALGFCCATRRSRKLASAWTVGCMRITPRMCTCRASGSRGGKKKEKNMATLLDIAWRAFKAQTVHSQKDLMYPKVSFPLISQQNNGLYGAGDNISCLVEKGGLHPGQPTIFKQFRVVSLPCVHAFRLWERVEAPAGNPYRERTCKLYPSMHPASGLLGSRLN